jgi:glycosyltransferase involved in cell wall biosynthesis
VTKISVIVPAKNEVDGIGFVIRGTREAIGEQGEIIIVDEHSTDGTVEAALEADSNVRVFQRDGSGKGNGIRKGIGVFSGDIFVILDADATFDPRDIMKVVGPIMRGECDAVLGSRIKGKREKGSMNLIHYVGNRLLNFSLSLRFGTWITDSQTGLRAMRGDVVRSIKLVSEGFDVEAELTVECLKKGYRVKEVPICFWCRKGNSKSKLRAFSDGWLIFRRLMLS